MGYVVIEGFVDMADGNHEYRTGDKFPRHGASVGAARIAELSGSGNKIGRPLLREVAETMPSEPQNGEKAETVRTDSADAENAAESFVEPVKR